MPSQNVLPLDRVPENRFSGLGPDDINEGETDSLLDLALEQGWRFESDVAATGKRILVIGAGKASARMAQAMERILGDRITSGVLVTKTGHALPLQSDIDLVLGLGGNTDGEDALYDQAVAIVIKDRKCSTSYIQRKLAIGYNKAARLVEQMEEQGVVSSANHVGKREILVPEPQ